MVLYIMRHAEAVEGSDVLKDEWRFLTENGRLSAKNTSSLIARYGPKPRLIISSPLTRAVQTAEIIAEKACRKNVVAASGFLLPGADISELAEHLKSCKDSKRVMLVGHEPQLGTLVTALLGCEDGTVYLKKGACVALKFDPDKIDRPACFLWYLPPGKKRTTSLKKAFPQR
ncbi:MAG: protein phosphatase [Geobacteraceae bacterium]|nr:protein phosphatase [Geobacteraceae bacterium]NTW81344.1 protein phosphatase [Geobacteraceae bacterium]